MRLAALALALAAVSAPVSASSLSSTFTAVSDYTFDGVSQTQNDPALQASLDFSAENGFYAGVWASNVEFSDTDPANTEIDLYAGFAKDYESGWGWTAGVVQYTYTGAPSSYDYAEITGGVTLPTTTTFQVWAADDDALGGGAWRAKVKHSFALPGEFSLDLEATRTQYEGSLYTDFTHGQIGVSREFGAFTAYLGYSDTNAPDVERVASNGDLTADGRFLFTLSAGIDWF